MLPIHERAVKSLITRPPANIAEQWASPSAPLSLGFTLAAPISSQDARAAEGAATNLPTHEVAGDSHGYWAVCPVFVLDSPKPTTGQAAKRSRSRGDFEDVHPFLDSCNNTGGLARFDHESAAKHDRVLIMGPLVDVKILGDGDLHMYVLDEHDEQYLADCKIPHLSLSLSPNKNAVTSATVTRQLGR